MSGRREHPHAEGVDRRQFLKKSGTVALGVSTLGFGARGALAATSDSTQPRVRRYRTLGRTQLEISDISFGSSELKDPSTVRYAFDRGVNYFDTAELYEKGGVEEKIGEALRDVRDRVYLASKAITRPDMKRARMMTLLEGSLRRLRTDYIDVFFNHAVNDVARMENPEWHEFVALAKQQGKIRFSGMSGHGGYLLDCLDYALDHDLVDVILAAYNFGSSPAFYERFTRMWDFVATQQGLPRLLEKAHRNGVGVLVMKTLMGARLNDMRPYEWGGATFAQAAFRWVFSDPNVDGLLVTMSDRALVDEYLGASGQSGVREADARLLRGYIAANGERHCRNGCSVCEASCPAGVQISDVLRARMYALDYGARDLAQTTYDALGAAADPCLRCTDVRCAGSCPYGLEIPKLTRETALLLGSETRKSGSGSGVLRAREDS